MHRTMLKPKIHRATVTDCDLHYVGSLTNDPDLLEAADVREFEHVAVVDVDNDARFETYTIAAQVGLAGAEGRRGGRPVGAPRRQGQRHLLPDLRPDGLEHHTPHVVHVDAHNEIAAVDDQVAALPATPAAA